MSEKSELQILVDSANARYTDPERNGLVNGTPGVKPRFELYHFNFSLYSQKVRGLLTCKNIPYLSHNISILPPIWENYFPEYVRLRLRGWNGTKKDLVSSYTGRSSVETEGFDPCVVPTLVDHEKDKVIVDAKAICRYVDEETPGPKLIPTDLEDKVMRQVDIVDRFPHLALLYGPTPEKDNRPDFMQVVMRTVYDQKIEQLESQMALVSDPNEIDAYKHKITKERNAKNFVASKAEMSQILQEVRETLAGLERDLEATGREWLFGDRFTLADIVWGITLFRLTWLGLSHLWEGDNGKRLPRVAAYSKRLFANPNLDRTFIHYPGAPYSEHVKEFYSAPLAPK